MPIRTSSSGQASRYQLLMCIVEPIHGALPAHPRDELAHAVRKSHARFIAEQRASQSDVAVAVTNVALAKFPQHCGGKVASSECAENRVRHLPHGRRLAGTYVDGLIFRPI